MILESSKAQAYGAFTHQCHAKLKFKNPICENMLQLQAYNPNKASGRIFQMLIKETKCI